MTIEEFERKRKRRLLQVFWLTELFLLIEAVHRLYANVELGLALSLALLLSALLLSPVWVLARQDALKLATRWLLTVLTLLVTALLWVFSGLSDEALLGYPCILVFAALMGLRRTFLWLTAFMLVNLLLIGLSNELGWVQHPPLRSTIDSGVVLALILAMLASSVWLMIGDLTQLVQALREENLRVHQSQQQIRQLINHDSLTLLPNRVLARERWEQSVQPCLQSGLHAAVLFIDLDNFKQVNDSLGHHAGDKLLQSVASRLRSQLRDADLVCRISGDEFLVLAAGFRHQTEVQQLAEKLLAAVVAPLDFGDASFSATCSIGIATAPNDGTDYEALCQKADSAMYQAKAMGRNHWAFFDASLVADKTATAR